MTRIVRGSLIAVLAIDVLVVVALLTGDSSVRAADSSGQAPASGEASTDSEPALGPETMRALGEELRVRLAEIELREAELEELLRAEAVLARAGLSAEPTVSADEIEQKRTEAEARAAAETRRATAFTSLSRAYENMEPDSAARALAALAARDRQAVVELLLGWQPRTSGAILDALTQVDAALAADLSYAIWSMNDDGSTSDAKPPKLASHKP